MDESDIGTVIVDCAVKLHQDLGPGVLETVYEVTLAHKKQRLTYLKLTGLKLGYLLNFGEALMKEGITRTINGSLS
jgi:hypothetical protein